MSIARDASTYYALWEIYLDECHNDMDIQLVHDRYFTLSAILAPHRRKWIIAGYRPRKSFTNQLKLRLFGPEY